MTGTYTLCFLRHTRMPMPAAPVTIATIRRVTTTPPAMLPPTIIVLPLGPTVVALPFPSVGLGLPVFPFPFPGSPGSLVQLHPLTAGNRILIHAYYMNRPTTTHSLNSYLVVRLEELHPSKCLPH